MDISVIIVNYNSGRLLSDCVRSLYDSTVGDLSIEVIIVNNTPRDESIDRVKRKFPRVRIILNKRNRYYSPANNQGIQVAAGKTVLILNPDTQIENDAVNRLYSNLTSDRTLGAVTGLMKYPDGQIQKNCSRFPRYRDLIIAYTLLGGLTSPIRNRLGHDYFYRNWDRLSSRDVEVIPGSIMMIPKEVLKKTGPFDSQMKMYFSDDDLCRRITQHGYRLRYVSNATFIHHEQQSVKQLPPKTVKALYHRDLLRFTRKHYGDVPAFILGGLTTLTGMAYRIRCGEM